MKAGFSFPRWHCRVFGWSWGAAVAAVSLALLTMVAQAQTCAPAPSGLVSWWRGEQNALDSADGNNGTLQGNAGFGSGEVGTAFSFDGTNGYVSVPASANLNVGLGSGFTLECWIKPTDVSKAQPLIEWFAGSGPPWGVHFWISESGSGTGPGCLFMNVPSTGGAEHLIGTVAGLVGTSGWQHVAATYDKATGVARLYYNGQLKETQNLGSFTPQTSYPLYLGRRPPGTYSGVLYRGGMDEVSVYNCALSAAEVQAIYAAGSAGKCVPTPPPSCVTPPSGLVSWWRGEQNALDSADSNNGTLQGSAGFTPGEVGQAFSFDGTNGYVSVPASANLNVGLGNGFTLECWIKPNDVSRPQPLLEWFPASALPSGVHLWISEAGSGTGPGCVYMDVVDTAGSEHKIGTVAGLVGTGGWQHVAATYDKATGVARLFYNGQLKETQNLGNITPQTSYPLYFGRRPPGPYGEWLYGGSMDEVAIYNRALSTNEIQAIYAAGSAGKCVPTPPPSCVTPPSGLVSWWRGEQNALDSADSNNGTLQGSAGFTPGEVGQAFSFDGTNGYVSVPASANLNVGLGNGFTLECWIKLADVSQRQPLLEWVAASGPPWGVHLWISEAVVATGPGCIYMNVPATSGVEHRIGTVAGLVGTNDWQHVVATYDKTTGVAKLYYNGQLKETQSWGSFTPQTSLALNMGRRPAGSYYPAVFYRGGMDEVAIYNRALSTNEIQAIYTAGSAGKCGPTPPSCVTAPSGLVSWWPAEGNGNDIIGGNNGSFLNGASFTAGEVGQAFSFNASGSYVRVPASPTLDVGAGNGLTIEAWINPADLTTQGPIVEWALNGAYAVMFYANAPDSAGRLYACLFSVSGGENKIQTTTGVLSANTYQHVALTYDKVSGLARLFRNGVIVQESNLGTFTPRTSSDLYIGYRPAGSPYGPLSFRGQIDEVSLYDRALSTNELQAIYYAGSAGKCAPAPLPAYDVARDFSTNSNPNGAWSYGYSTTLGGTFILHPERGNWNGLDFWRTNIWLGAPAVYYNSAPGTTTNITIALESHQLAFHPGPNGEFCVIRFTAPTSGVFRVVGAVKGVDTVGTTTDVHIRARGIPTLDGLVTGFGPGTGPAFDFTVALGAGDTVDFAVGRGSNNEFSNDSTGISVQILPGNGTPPSCVPAPSGLVSWWQGEGNAEDAVGGLNGILSGGAGFAAGLVGQAFSFDGVDDYVQIGARPELVLSNALTVEAWIFPTGAGSGPDGGGIIISKEGEYVMDRISDGTIRWAIAGTGPWTWTATPLVAPLNVWTHLALVYDSGVVEIYGNGNLVQTNTGPTVLGDVYPTLNDFRIGGRQAISECFKGLIDEVAVFKRALTANEIQAIYNAGSAGKCGIAPAIITQPASQTVAAGADVTFTVAATGSRPLGYQWWFNATNLIAGATNSSLTLSNVLPAASGDYTVVVSNSINSVTSARADLSVRYVFVFGNGQNLTNSQYTFVGSVNIQLQTFFPNGTQFYTLDGSPPSFASSQYGGPFAVSRSATLRVITYSADFLQSWELDPIALAIIPTYSLTVSTAGGGTVAVAPPNGPYISNTVVSVTANPASGWTFLGWLGDASGPNPAINLTMDRNRTVQARFGTALNTTVAGSGSVILIPSGGFYPFGTVVQLYGVPQSGNYFALWGNAGSGSSNPLNFTLTNANPTVSSLFAPLAPGEFMLTVVPDGLGQVLVDPPADYYTGGQNVTLTAVPGAGQLFLGWTGDASGTNTSLTVVMSQSKAIVANFTRRPSLNVLGDLNGLNDQGFRLTLTGEFGGHYRIDGSTNLLDWTELMTITNTYGTEQIIDGPAMNLPARAYKAVQVP